MAWASFTGDGGCVGAVVDIWYVVGVVVDVGVVCVLALRLLIVGVYVGSELSVVVDRDCVDC